MIDMLLWIPFTNTCLQFCIPTLCHHVTPLFTALSLLCYPLSHHRYYPAPSSFSLGLWTTPSPQFLLFIAGLHQQQLPVTLYILCAILARLTDRYSQFGVFGVVDMSCYGVFRTAERFWVSNLLDFCLKLDYADFHCNITYIFCCQVTILVSSTQYALVFKRGFVKYSNLEENLSKSTLATPLADATWGLADCQLSGCHHFCLSILPTAPCVLSLPLLVADVHLNKQKLQICMFLTIVIPDVKLCMCSRAVRVSEMSAD